MPVDYHNHTVLCHHAVGLPEEYLDRAASVGIREFGFAEHSYWMVRPDGRNLCPSREEMDDYLEWMTMLRERFDGVKDQPVLRVGLEADWVPERLDEALAFVASYPFDFIYGSVHHLREPHTGQWACSWWFNCPDTDAVYEAYFFEMGRLIESGLCDILAHVDVIRRSERLPSKPLTHYVEPLIPAILRKGLAVEINTSGRDHVNKDFFPCESVLKLLVDAGVPLTIGSDGHAPEHVGRHRREALALLRRLGVRELAAFENRRMRMVPLE